MCEKPSPRVLWSWWAAVWLPLCLLTVVGRWLYRPLLYWFIPLWFVCGVYLWLRRQRMVFAIEGGYIHIRSGVWIATQRSIPLKAVRQVTLLQGPIERRCGTAFVLVNSTGGYLFIEGIDHRRAQEWCRRLTSGE